MKLFNVTIERKNTEVIDQLQSIVGTSLQSAVTKQSAMLTDEIRKRYFTSSFGALTKNGKLAQSIKPFPTLQTDNIVRGGVNMGELPWASNFIGPVGQRVTVHGKPFLAIPMSKKAADLQNSVPTLKSLDLYRVSHLLFDKDVSRSVSTKKSKGREKKYVPKESGAPLFILKRSQSIRAKIHPEKIAAEYLFPVTAGIRREVFVNLKAVVRG